MSAVLSARLPAAGRRHPALIFGALVIFAASLNVLTWSDQLPTGQWLHAILSPDRSDMGEITLHYSWLPRLFTSLLCGAALGLAGAVLQQVLRNPLASPQTLGISAGASLALALMAILQPAFIVWAREWVAFAGAMAALAFVFALTWRKALSPVAVVLAGMVFSLFGGALSAVIIIFHQQYLVGLLIWGSGSLSQQDWSAVVFLTPRVALIAVLIALMQRPLTLIGLDDSSARSLGLATGRTRFAALILAVALSACVVSSVGVIGFIGLASPALANLMGARRFSDRLIWAPLLGAALLWAADSFVQFAAGLYGDLVPTGALTALLGSPLLLWLLPRLRVNAQAPALGVARPPARARSPVLLVAILLGLVLTGAVWAILVGGIPGGLTLSDSGLLAEWRWPTVLAAIAAGAMLAIAGTMLQRLTGNEMASPEALGVSAGAALGYVIVAFAAPEAGRVAEIAFGGAGALAVLLGIMALGRRSHFSPERILLAGIAFGALFDALVVALTATGDPRAGAVLAWLTGSTYRVTASDAITVAAAAFLSALGAFLTVRWLDILPLGSEAASAAGIDMKKARLAVLLVSAIASAAATLVVGPLSFAGLIAPHIARMAGLQRASAQLAGAALTGALIMVVADWIGRVVLFPQQIPAGLIACLIGAPYLMLRLSLKE